MAMKSKKHSTLAKAVKSLELNGYQQSVRVSSNDALAVFTKVEDGKIIEAKCLGHNGGIKVVYSSQPIENDATN